MRQELGFVFAWNKQPAGAAGQSPIGIALNRIQVAVDYRWLRVAAYGSGRPGPELELGTPGRGGRTAGE
jgi:hypothetical protein